LFFGIIYIGESLCRRTKWRQRMKKNEETTKVEETKLVWKLKDLPDAEAVASLVETKVITPEEARGILFREEVKQSDEVEALKEMVATLQGMVKEFLSRPTGIVNVPYTRVIEVPARQNPYWNKYWTATAGNTTLTTTNSGNAVYTLSI
jgi:hypothetical protein